MHQHSQTVHSLTVFHTTMTLSTSTAFLTPFSPFTNHLTTLLPSFKSSFLCQSLPNVTTNKQHSTSSYSVPIHIHSAFRRFNNNRKSSSSKNYYSRTSSFSAVKSKRPRFSSTSKNKSHPRSRPFHSHTNDYKDESETLIDVDLTSNERLQKVLSRLGVASRRRSEQLIASGNVSVNGRQTTEMGTLVNVWHDEIYVNGIKIEIPSAPIWLAFHKPTGYRSIVSLQSISHSLNRFLSTHIQNPHLLVAAGAIEEDASGLLVLTNERGAIPPLVKPDNPHVQIWHVQCLGIPNFTQMTQLNTSVVLNENESPVRSTAVLIDSGKGDVSSKERALMSSIEIRVRDSRHRVIRRMCETVGLSVVRLSRRSFGPVLLRSLRPGEYRHMQQKEIKALRRGVSEQTVKSWK